MKKNFIIICVLFLLGRSHVPTPLIPLPAVATTLYTQILHGADIPIEADEGSVVRNLLLYQVFTNKDVYKD